MRPSHFHCPLRYLASVLMAIVVAGFAGCSSDDDRGQPRTLPPNTTTSSTPTGNPEEVAARDASVAAYNGYWEAYVKAAETSDVTNPDLVKYVAHPLLGQVQADLLFNKEQGLIMSGRPTWDAKVTTVNLSARPFTVDLEGCFDSTNWKAIRKATGADAGAPGQATRYLIVSRAIQYDDGRWLIRESNAQRERPC